MRALPSEIARKFALPKLRIASTRPAVRVWTFSASSASAVLAECASTSCDTVSVRSKTCGYAATPSFWSSSKFARRWRSWSDSFCSAVCCSSVIAVTRHGATLRHKGHTGHEDHKGIIVVLRDRGGLGDLRVGAWAAGRSLPVKRLPHRVEHAIDE